MYIYIERERGGERGTFKDETKSRDEERRRTRITRKARRLALPALSSVAALERLWRECCCLVRNTAEKLRKCLARRSSLQLSLPLSPSLPLRSLLSRRQRFRPVSPSLDGYFALCSLLAPSKDRKHTVSRPCPVPLSRPGSLTTRHPCPAFPGLTRVSPHVAMQGDARRTVAVAALSNARPCPQTLPLQSLTSPPLPPDPCAHISTPRVRCVCMLRFLPEIAAAQREANRDAQAKAEGSGADGKKRQ